jgi:hypothetical protein
MINNYASKGRDCLNSDALSDLKPSQVSPNGRIPDAAGFWITAEDANVKTQRTQARRTVSQAGALDHPRRCDFISKDLIADGDNRLHFGMTDRQSCRIDSLKSSKRSTQSFTRLNKHMS